VQLPRTEDQGPLVSVITPAYNHEKYIGACLESILHQSYYLWEQIVMDDGSTDSTSNIVSEFRDPRIRFEHQANQGAFELANTYNRALSLAKGEFIAILEGDDFWPPDKLATLVHAFQDDHVVLAYGEAADVDAKGREQRTKSHTTRLRESLPHSVLFNDPVGSATRYMLLAEGRSLVSPSTVIIRRSTLEQIGGFQYVAGLPLTDYPTFMELSVAGKFHYSPQIMGYRRHHQNSVTIHHEQKIYDMVSSFALRFLDKHQDKIVLSPSEREELNKNWQQAQDKLHFSQGRSLLLQQKWSEARSHFRIASTSKQVSVRLASFAGLLFSWLHADIEPLMRLGGRAGLRVQDGL
jgi:glycosyltransferase involved in cell wall biosynthesis